MKKNILIIGDIVGHGRLAVLAQSSVLSPLGHNISNLPTALVSNNFCYGKYAMLDTTQYMRESIEVWESIGFVFDVISIGFIATDLQAEMLISFCKKQKEMGAKIIVDPIMADNGTLYNGIGVETIGRLRKIISIADLTVPNYTEACLLTDTEFHAKGFMKEEIKPVIDKICALGAASVLVTSAHIDEKPFVVGYDHNNDAYLSMPYREVPVQFSGTGDIFTAMLISRLLKGNSLSIAATITMEQLSALIEIHYDAENKEEGLPI
ncbi:MAG: bifunctional hydroxymethylpyrimidine kinase/phosphomethylpyrimidine kinase [Bacteroidales bacterium]|nr:bifunctional hydroxymethylpyrimidine kinase/phosphomethylpyrimidine kinase [Bacteroidales bacterium]